MHAISDPGEAAALGHLTSLWPLSKCRAFPVEPLNPAPLCLLYHTPRSSSGAPCPTYLFSLYSALPGALLTVPLARPQRLVPPGNVNLVSLRT